MARSFNDAASQYLEVASAPITTYPFTMACWFNTDDNTHDSTLMSIADTAGAVNYHRLQAAGAVGGDPVRAYSRDGPGAADSTAGWAANAWHHACGVWAANNDRRAFLDGGNRGNNANVSNDAGIDTTAIGRTCDSTPSDYMSGSIAEAAMWNVALSDAEVAVLGVGVRPVFVRPANLVFYVPLLRDDDEDIVGGLSLTATNGPTVVAHCAMYYTASMFTGLGVGAGAVPALAMHHYRKRRSKN